MEENNNKKETVFQRLTQVFSANDTNKQPNVEFDIPNKELITAHTPEELEVKKLEFKQDYFIQQQYSKVVQDSEQKALQALSLRLPAIYDYIAMDNYPLFSQALNLLAEEATTIGENGKMLTVYSDNKALKRDLEILFYETLSINSTLHFWARNMCKYGDTFLYLLTNKDRGIIDVRPLPALEMERKEEIERETYKVKTKFLWRQRNEEYTIWQIAHFRLLADDRWLPYGTSILSPVRVTWRQLKMSEDAALVYRAARASERRVIKVNVGNADPADVPMLIQNAASKFKRTSLVDPQTGNINYKFNPATVEQDIFIAVRSDNASNPIETLQGATNLNDIADIEYFLNQTFMGLGIAKIFLGYSSDSASEGGGKNLAQLDVRFARKVNRIQQCLLQELNKMAMIHLLILGYDEEEIRNFTLSLTNPSTQSEMLKVENWLQKMDLFVKATTPNDKGVQPMSDTRAKKEILGWSDDEVLEDLKQQLIEKVVASEIENSTTNIKSSKIFNELYKYYDMGLIGNTPAEGQEGNVENAGAPPVGGETGGEEATLGNIASGSAQPPAPEDTENQPTNLAESFIRKNKRINAQLEDLIKEFEKDEKLKE